ncbi:MAG: DUF488 domain-containing protein [Chitinispirillales bacterium]|jgi:uncharacterized protein YeaO (DUF488 family)|nr:DUF488 domain-containing protein [Chitinispirillales bacterium]
MKQLQIKRIYEAPSPNDGIRILVDRLWPRGIKKSEARLDYWFKEIAPSPELRKWFGHQPERFEEFSKKYTRELDNNKTLIGQIKEMLKSKNVTLLYAAKNHEMNQAAVLRNYIIPYY